MRALALFFAVAAGVALRQTPSSADDRADAQVDLGSEATFKGKVAATDASAEAAGDVDVSAKNIREKAQGEAKAKVLKADALSPLACDKAGACPKLQCPVPLELQFKPGGCCPICWAPDHIVPLDRHSAIDNPNESEDAKSSLAPANCQNVKCFTMSFPMTEIENRCCKVPDMKKA
jgi:hypothetical protein